MQLNEIKTCLSSALYGGDILLIVPPFVTTQTPILGPAILQSLARQCGYHAQILHLNLLFASVIGIDLYEQICYGQPFRMAGERVFARSAYRLPPLGLSPELCAEPARSVFGNRHEALVEEIEYQYLNSDGFDLKSLLEIEECCTTLLEEAACALASRQYKIVGCSSNWEQNNCCVALLDHVKRLCPETITLIGGANCEGEMAEGVASLTEAIDYIFSGEGETIFTTFLQNYANAQLPAQRILVGMPTENLDAIPLPDYESYLVQREIFLGQNSPEQWSPGYESSRGCWWGKCYFCGLNGFNRGSFRQKSIEKTLHDLETIQRYPALKSIIMADKVMPRSYQKALLPILSERQQCALAYEQRPNLSLQDLICMKNANIQTIKPGIEAFSTDLLKLMNKGITAKQNLLLLRNAAALEIYVDWNLLWGFPGDQVEQYEDTLHILRLIHHFCPPAVFRHICIDRFSPYFEQAQDFGIANLRPWAVYAQVYPGWADTQKLAYRFIGDYACAAHEHPDVIRAIAEELTLWKQRWSTSRLMLLPFGEFYMIYDTRGIHAKTQTHVVTGDEAKIIMTPAPYEQQAAITQALEQKLGVIVDSWYVPLVTASPELLLKFEEERLCI